MMYFKHLNEWLDTYATYLQSVYRHNVQVRTGALRDSIKVWCQYNGQKYQLHFSMRNYWKWILQPFPIEKAGRVAGTKIDAPVIYKAAPYDENGIRYKIDWSFWQQKLNEAYEQDIMANLNGEYS